MSKFIQCRFGAQETFLILILKTAEQLNMFLVETVIEKMFRLL